MGALYRQGPLAIENGRGPLAILKPLGLTSSGLGAKGRRYPPMYDISIFGSPTVSDERISE